MNAFYEKMRESVFDGDSEIAVSTAREMISDGIAAIDIVQKYLVPILGEVGEKFSQLEIFLPDLLAAAEVAKALKDEVSEAIKGGQAEPGAGGKIVIGTVQGDVHDIGKNIVSTLLEVNGFDVIDLGIDVTPFQFIEAAQKEKADIIALSSLLTTSMPYMVEVIKALDGLKIRDQFKVVVGGGPVHKAWADSIGADGYGNDVNDAVEVCRSLVKGAVS